MNLASSFFLAWLAIRELGFGQLGYYAIYQLGLRSGHYRRLTSGQRPPSPVIFRPSLQAPDSIALRQVMGESAIQSLLTEADALVSGQVKLFGAEAKPLLLAPSGPLLHWTEYELGRGAEAGVDHKFTWEPVRFGWAYTLASAYRISGDERYPAAFWQYVETFLEGNPAYLGPNWASAQEVALRLIAFSFSLQIFASAQATTEQRNQRLVQSIIEHAVRIPPTLVYARAQNNNHLLSEAAALYTAGVFIPEHTQAKKWRTSGWKWFNHGVQSQINSGGAYSQHSTNYHRLMLQLALWFNLLAEQQGQRLPDQTHQRLARATSWLLALVDPESGQVPNLGPNDGAYIQPLTTCPFNDYRPVLQAAASVFLGKRPFSDGAWDDVSLWLKPDHTMSKVGLSTLNSRNETPHVIRFPGQSSWAYLRVANFNSRPGHADQLHLDLWWRGLNLAQDAGTYLYTAPAPWDNALPHTAVHNTLTINGLEQMRRVGRFLYLDWAQAHCVEGEQNADGSWRRVVAVHNGYRRLGVIHQRSVAAVENGDWLVEDTLLPGKVKYPLPDSQFQIRLHWLLPDWPWELVGSSLRLQSPYRDVHVSLEAAHNGSPLNLEIGLARAGQSLAGAKPAQPTWGWVSPTYGIKQPALSFSATATCSLMTVFTTHWSFSVE